MLEIRDLINGMSSTTGTQTVPLIDPANPSHDKTGLGATVRQLISFCARERLWVGCIVVFVVTWTVELYMVQAITLVYPNDTGARFAFWAPKIRLALDALFVSSLALLLRRRVLVFVVCGAFLTYLGLIGYFKFFLRPISLLTILASWREGWQLSGFAPDLFPKHEAMILGLALGVELGALLLSRKAALPRSCAWLVGGVLATGYCGLYAIANYCDPLDTIQVTHGVGRLGEIRGYLGPWFAEWYYLRNSRVLEAAIQRRKTVYNRLTPIEASIPIHKRLVILQAESLDTNILDFKANGELVTPFLSSLRKMSMYYRVRAIHYNGSADADFAALNGVAGSDHTITYKLNGYPYENTTPQLLARCGYSVISFHGNSGEFYDRRRAFDRIGFADILFREELESRYHLAADRWGVQDRAVLDLSAQLLRTATVPTCHFIITLTTHVPYTSLSQADKEVYPRPRSTEENYVNNMRYLDSCMRDFITKLGAGATVMIYADHPAEEGNSGFTPDRIQGREFIPCFIYDTDQDLSKLQRTRNDPRSRDGSWNLIDVVNYLRAQVESACESTSQVNHPDPRAE